MQNSQNELSYSLDVCENRKNLLSSNQKNNGNFILLKDEDYDDLKSELKGNVLKNDPQIMFASEGLGKKGDGRGQSKFCSNQKRCDNMITKTKEKFEKVYGYGDAFRRNQKHFSRGRLPQKSSGPKEVINLKKRDSEFIGKHFL
jgi:hypothetical protein